MTVHRCAVCGSIVPPVAATCAICGAPAATGLVSAALIPPAAVSRRTAAAILDQLPVALLIAAAVSLPLLGAPGWWWLVALGGAVAWTAMLWWWSAAAGSSPGKRWLGLVVVQAVDGGLPGAAPALGRLLVRGGLCLATLGIAGLSYRWDPDGRQHTWWDRICGTRVNQAVDQRRPSSMAAMTRWAPDVVDVPVGAEAPVSRPPGAPLSQVARGVGVSVPAAGLASEAPGFDPTTASRDPATAGVATCLGPTSSPQLTVPVMPVPTGGSPPAPSSSGALRFVPGPVPQRARDPRPADRAEFLARPLVGDALHAVPVARAGTSHPAAETESREPGTQQGTVVGAPSTAGGFVVGAPTTAGAFETGAPSTAVGSPTNVSPTTGGSVGLITGIPVDTGTASGTLADPTSSGNPTGNPELIFGKAPGRAMTAQIIWDTGSPVTIRGRVLIGRDPSPAPGEDTDKLLAVTADSVGVSKTHLQIDVGPSGLVVTDRHSTNGVRVIRPDGTVQKLQPGAPVSVHRGDVVYFGGRSVTIA